MAQPTTTPKMKYKTLGKSGLKVSEICLGCMTFNTDENNKLTPTGRWIPMASEEESVNILDKFVEYGGNFFDTAELYLDSEVLVGKWLTTKNREDMVIATKAFRTMRAQGPNDSGLGRKHVKAAIDGSLKRLQTDYVDLYQAHLWDDQTPIEETLRTLNELVRAGKVRYLGVSNFNGWQLQKSIDYLKYMGLENLVSLQPQYHLLTRQTEWELIPVCLNEGLGVLPWSPLAGGWLTGKFKRDNLEVTGSRVGWAEKAGWKATDVTTRASEHTWQVLDAVEKVAKETNRTMAQVSLRWLMQRPAVTAPIIGAKTVAQLEDNLGCISFSLSQEQMDELNKASAVDVPYPWGDIFRTNSELAKTHS